LQRATRLKSATQTLTERIADLSEGAPPPSYSAAPFEAASGSGSLPTNYLLVQRKDGSIHGRWTIDTTVQVPPSLLGTLPKGVTVRPNIRLEAKHGLIDAEVHVMGAAERALIEADTRDGSVLIKVVCNFYSLFINELLIRSNVHFSHVPLNNGFRLKQSQRTGTLPSRFPVTLKALFPIPQRTAERSFRQRSRNA